MSTMLLVRNPKTGRLFLNALINKESKIESRDDKVVKAKVCIVPERTMEECDISFELKEDKEKFFITFQNVLASL